ncbi:MAG: serine/threonine protein phosphatase [Magnetococcales bacterium]|nr:serine/threonine protein phosphatase [Magnetococcales bacterium]NGZ28483.1 serine/threonine protein phosphatase [Magnetococcales bacterium]
MMLPLVVRPYAQPQMIKEIPFPPQVRFGQILVLGPPGVGKSTLIQRLGGWMEEGHLDLADPFWWRSRALTYTPREVHLYLPFMGRTASLAVYSPDWLSAPTPIDFARIRIPPPRDGLFAVDWRNKFVFDFILPPVEQVLAWREERARQGTHLVDEELSREQVQVQLLIFWNIAKHLHRCGLLVYLRTAWDQIPLEILDTMDYPFSPME